MVQAQVGTPNDVINVVNNKPLLLNYSFSRDSVERTNTTVISINSSDIEDAESLHTIVVQLKPSEGSWSTDDLSNLWYNSSSSRWETNFTPSTTAELGLYDLRIMVNDTDDATTNWIVYENAVTVSSNPPILTDYSVINNNILRTETSIIVVGVSDIEDDNDDMTLTVQHRFSSEDWSSSYFDEPWYNSSAGKWEANFTPTTTASLGEYDIRVRVTDLDYGSSSWSTHLDNITVGNNNPTLDEYSLSNSSVLRNSTIVISIDSDDVEDLDSLHTITAQLRFADEDWGNDLLGNAWYDSSESLWKVNFTPISTSELGLYDLRIMVNDTDDDSSNWNSYDDVITVTNNNPTLQYMIFSSDEVLRTEVIVIEIDVLDIEDSDSLHSIEIQYKLSNSNWSDDYLSSPWYNVSSGKWEANFTPPTTAGLGHYDFRLNIEDSDDGESGWIETFNSEVEVINNIATIEDFTNSASFVLKNQTLIFGFNSSDIEDLESDLTLTANYRSPTGDWSDNYLSALWYNADYGHWETNFTPLPSAELGYYDIRISVEDTDGDSSNWSTFEDSIHVISNPPVITNYSITHDEILRTESSLISIDVYDVEDPSQNLTVLVQYRSPSGNWSVDDLVTVSYNSDLGVWETYFTPNTTAELGAYDFRVKAIDLDNGETQWLNYEDNILVINNIPIYHDYQLTYEYDYDILPQTNNSLLRTDGGMIFVKSTDVEDNSTLHEVIIELKSPTGVWSSDYIRISENNTFIQGSEFIPFLARYRC